MPKVHLSGLISLVLVGLLAACSTLNGESAPLRADPFSIDRGREIAQFHCASCHQVGPSGPSPSLMAPPFHSVYISYSRLAFKKAVEDASGDRGHFMPGYDLNRAQVDDLVAYLESIRHGAPVG